MTGFPGRIFDGEGRPLDGFADDLTQDQLDAAQHRSAVQRGGGRADDGMMRPVAVIWLLDDAAAFKDVPLGILSASVGAALSGQAVLILARLPEVGVEFRDSLMEALELGEAPDDVAGHA